MVGADFGVRAIKLGGGVVLGKAGTGATAVKRGNGRSAGVWCITGTVGGFLIGDAGWEGQILRDLLE